MPKNPRSLVARGEFRKLLDRSSFGPVLDHTRFQWQRDVLRIHYDTGAVEDVATLVREVGVNIQYIATTSNGKRRVFGMRTSAIGFCETHAKKLIVEHEASVAKRKR